METSEILAKNNLAALEIINYDFKTAGTEILDKILGWISNIPSDELIKMLKESKYLSSLYEHLIEYSHTADDSVDSVIVKNGLSGSLMFRDPDYESAIVGYDVETKSIIYSYDLMVQSLCEEEGMTLEDAIEFIDYNTLRALKYINKEDGPRPIVLKPFSIFRHKNSNHD